VLEPATIGACTTSTSSVARTARCTPAMRETRVRVNGRTTHRPWREVHGGSASGAAGVSGSVPVCGEGSGTRVRREATYSRAEGCVGRQRETTPPLNQHFQEQIVKRIARRWCSHVRLRPQLAGSALRRTDVWPTRAAFHRRNESLRCRDYDGDANGRTRSSNNCKNSRLFVTIAL
jgi:hypothetical protein